MRMTSQAVKEWSPLGCCGAALVIVATSLWQDRQPVEPDRVTTLQFQHITDSISELKGAVSANSASIQQSLDGIKTVVDGMNQRVSKLEFQMAAVLELIRVQGGKIDVLERRP